MKQSGEQVNEGKRKKQLSERVSETKSAWIKEGGKEETTEQDSVVTSEGCRQGTSKQALASE